MLFTRRWRQDFFLSTFHDEWNLLLECTTITISEQSISHSIQTSAVQWLTNHSTSSLFAVCCSQSPTLLCLHLEGKIVVCLFVCFKLTSIFELHSSIEPNWDLFKSTNSFVLNFARLDKGRLCYHTHSSRRTLCLILHLFQPRSTFAFQLFSTKAYVCKWFSELTNFWYVVVAFFVCDRWSMTIGHFTIRC